MVAVDGLVISGGAARGAAFLGALHRLQKEHVLDGVRVVAGTSVGALAAALVCRNADMHAAMLTIAANPFELELDLVTVEPPFGVDSGLNLLRFIRSLIGTETFASLQARTGRDLVVCATSLHTKAPRYFCARDDPDMEVARAVHLSCSLPLLFAYGEWEGEVFVDGGLSDNFPVTAATSAGCERVLGLRLRQRGDEELPADLIEYIMTLMSCVAWQAKCKDSECWRVVELDVEQQAALDFSMGRGTLQRLFRRGFDAVQGFDA